MNETRYVKAAGIEGLFDAAVAMLTRLGLSLYGTRIRTMRRGGVDKVLARPGFPQRDRG